MSVIPWRKAVRWRVCMSVCEYVCACACCVVHHIVVVLGSQDVKHIQNEVYFDLYEDIDCVIDTNGAIVR